jgi:hypothetical protein
MVALAAVLLTSLSGLSPELRGWRPDHAHATLSGIVPPHHHQWDSGASAPVAAERENGSTAGVAFTDPDADSIGVGAFVIAGEPLLDLQQAPLAAIRAASAPAPASYLVRTPNTTTACLTTLTPDG